MLTEEYGRSGGLVGRTPGHGAKIAKALKNRHVGNFGGALREICQFVWPIARIDPNYTY